MVPSSTSGGQMGDRDFGKDTWIDRIWWCHLLVCAAITLNGGNGPTDGAIGTHPKSKHKYARRVSDSGGNRLPTGCDDGLERR